MAKFRNGFVSNSSSSSFIIAVKSDARREDIERAFYDQRVSIKSFLESNNEWLEIFNGNDDQDIDIILKEFITECVDRIRGYQSNGLVLDTWVVSSDEFSNESGDDFGVYVYDSMPEMDKDYLKIISQD